ncbi:Transposable element tcb1 transposase [Caligus rogercresseyi]|uniref:Transposable element tcb1 transposase n=1 Tax=Caligus rogercresseyi TaxID=217165 RepID=A0A7T8HH92_CALRO|nr:Transposable element tcb1 transposase [Caligus rogercresseyi]
MSTLAERLNVHRTTVLHAIHEDLIQFGAKLVLRESRHVLVKGVLAPSSPDLNPYYVWGRAHNTVDSLKAAIIQAVANLSREQVAHAVGRFRHRVEVFIVKGGSWIE